MRFLLVTAIVAHVYIVATDAPCPTGTSEVLQVMEHDNQFKICVENSK